MLKLLRELQNGGATMCYEQAGADGAAGGGGGEPAGDAAAGGDAGGDKKAGADGAGNQPGGDGDGQPAGDNPDGGNQPGDGQPNWREDFAEDEKDLEFLNRFADKKSVMKMIKAQRAKISSGELKAPLPENATPEQVAEYRKENGIPEKADGYMEGLDENIVFGEDDKAALDPFLAEMHERNELPETVHTALAAYQRAKDMQIQRIQEQDAQIKAAAEDELRAEWEGDYRTNLTAVDNFLDGHFSADVKMALMNARDEAGKPLMYNADFLRSCANLGRELNPVGATFGNGADNLDAIDTELAGLKKKMGTKDWYRDEAGQKRYRELLQAKERFSKK